MINLLINKYQSLFLNNINNKDDNIHQFINKLIDVNELKIIIIGSVGSGKSTFISNILDNYYNNCDSYHVNKKDNNILYINNLKEQGISFYKSDVEIFCKSICEIKNKKKTIVLDDIELLSDQNQQIFKIHMDNYIDRINFICSSNNLNKVNKGILSHLINIKLKNIDNIILKEILTNICLKEKIFLSEVLKNNIILYSDKSIKMLINNLEKYRILENKDIQFNIKMINNNLLDDILYNYFDICFTKNIQKAYNILYSVFNDGYSLIDIIDYIHIYLKNNINANKNICIDNNKKHQIIKILSKYTISINNSYEDAIILYFLTLDIILII